MKIRAHPIVRRTATLVTFLLLLTGCHEIIDAGGSDAGDSGIGVSGSEPATEGTGPERPARRQPNPPAINLPQLPAGTRDITSFAAADISDIGRKCIEVSWLGPKNFPAGVVIEVTNVHIAQSTPVFIRQRGGCDATDCRSSRAFTFTSADRSTCAVPLEPVGFGEAELTLSGTLVCPAGRQRECIDFATAAKRADAAREPIALQITQLTTGGG
jgi:hypothetical protein